MKYKVSHTLLAAWSYLLILLIYAPFFVMLILSFQGPSGTPTFPMQGSSLYWYKKVFNITATAEELAKAADEGTALGSYVPPLIRSLVLALLTAFISTVLGAMAAMGFRKPFKGTL